MLRRNTAEFIAFNYTDVSFTSQSQVRTDSGGLKIVRGVARPLQRVRLIDTSGSTNPEMPVQRTVDGVERETAFVLLADWDADVRLFDTWWAGSVRHEVTDLFPFNGYEVRARVVRLDA